MAIEISKNAAGNVNGAIARLQSVLSLQLTGEAREKALKDLDLMHAELLLWRMGGEVESG